MSSKKKTWKLLPLARAIGVLSAVGIITTMVTFAALQSTGNALTGNTIETATANLQISKDGTTFSDSVPGYDFNNIIPGGTPQPVAGGGYLVVIKNTGTTNVALSLSVPTEPNAVGITDLGQVYVLVTAQIPGGGSYPVQPIKLSDLIAGKVPLAWGTGHGMVNQSMTQSFHLQVVMDATAVTGGSASITGLDLSFSGAPQ